MLSDQFSQNLSEEDLWQTFLLTVSGEGHSFPDAVESPFIISILSGLHDDLSISQQNFLARKMLTRLSERVRDNIPFNDIDLNILRLTFPYFTRSDVLAEVRLFLRTSFKPETWRRRSVTDVRALADSLLDIDVVDSTPANWLAYYEYALQFPELSNDAFDQTGTALIGIGIKEFFDFFGRAESSDKAQFTVETYLPALLTQYGKAVVGRYLSQFLRKFPDYADLKSAAVAAGLDIASSELPLNLGKGNSLIEQQLNWAYDLLKVEMQRDSSNLIQHVIQSDRIKMVYSDYAGSPHITKFQQSLMNEIERLGAGTEMFPTLASTFDEVPPEISGLQRLVFLFPMYLTSYKRDKAGYGVIPYGVQKRIGALVPATNPLQRLLLDEVPLEYLLDEAAKGFMPVYCHRNYAMAEMVVQCVDSNASLRKAFPKRLIRSIEERPRKGFSPLQQFRKLPESNWIYLFDLGDLEQISKVCDGLGNSKIFSVSHELAIQVGVGFNRYMVPWMLENNRWEILERAAHRLLSHFNMAAHLQALGIETDRSPDSPATESYNVVNLEPKRQKKL
jgi:hypothetical protein